MKPRHLFIAAALLASGCSYTPGDNLMDSQLHSPFAYKVWTVEKSTAPDGSKVCVLDAGYDSIRASISNAGVAVSSNRAMDIGTTLSVTVGSSHFETSNTSFSARDSAAMVESMKQGGKAYLEWSEVHGNGTSRVRTQGIVLLDNFAMQLDECRRSLKQH